MSPGGTPFLSLSSLRASSPATTTVSIVRTSSVGASGNQEICLPRFAPAGQPDLKELGFGAVPAHLIQEEAETRAEMLDGAIRDHEDYYPGITSRASENTRQAFGFHTVQVDPIVHTYCLVSTIEISHDRKLHGVLGTPKPGLLIVLIMFTEGTCVCEELVWRGMCTVGLDFKRGLSM